MNARDIAEAGEILRGQVGSGLHGTGISGQDDRDEMGVCLEPPTHVIGLERFEQWILRINLESGVHKQEGERSGHGDLDLTVYSLRKYVSLAAKGNPSILALLFVPEEERVIETELGTRLREMAPLIISRCAGARYLGYMQSQRDRLLGLRGGRHGGSGRPELLEAHGFDTKYAMHMARLPIQGIELLSTGRITFPVPEPERAWLQAVRRGDIPLDEIIKRTEELEKRLIWLADGSAHVRTEPDYSAINKFLVKAYQDFWSGAAR